MPDTTNTTTTTSSTTTTDSAAAAAASPEIQLLNLFSNIIQAAASPDALEAQTILMRRLALEGDVIPSRIPPPKNITEIGGYLNLLGTLREPAMREQALAGALGIAGPNPPLGWMTSAPSLSFANLPNDRPAGPSQPQTPLTFSVRGDFASAMNTALQALHDQGCMLPFVSLIPPLPPGTPGAQVPVDALPFLGRTLDIVPGAALVDPANDPIVLARAQGSADPFAVMARVLSPGKVAVAAANYDALKCDKTTCTPIAANAAQFVPVAPVLATAGFYPGSPLPQPITVTSSDWAHFSNITGFVVGKTKLGDELSLVYSTAAIIGSVFAAALNWTWNGTKFSA